MKQQNSFEYLGIVHGDEKSFGISFPDFPGCISAGDTMDELITMAKEALTGHIECMIERDMRVPLPRTRAQFARDPEYDEWTEDMLQFVHVALDSKLFDPQYSTRQEAFVQNIKSASV